MLPSKTSLMRHGKKVEAVAQILCPVESYSNSNIGEGFKFNFKKSVKLLYEAHKMLETATVRPVEISSSIDGATLTKSLGVVAAGMKLIDISCKDPLSNEHVNMPLQDKCLVQSRENCFPLQTSLAKDASETHNNFESFFNFMADLSTDVSTDENERPINKIYPEMFPCKLSSTADMVGHNKGVKKGGGCYSTDFSCVHCDETRDMCYKPKDALCGKICQQHHSNREQWFCYHKPMVNEKT